MQVNVTEIKNGSYIKYEDHIYIILGFQHVKNSAFVKTTLKNILSGEIKEQTFQSDEKIEKLNVDKKEYQYSYNNEGSYTFVDTSTYDQIELQKDIVGEQSFFLKQEMTVELIFYEGKVIGIELPPTLILKVIETKTSTNNTTKEATLETGAKVQVPLIIEVGTIIKVDTRDSRYLGKA